MCRCGLARALWPWQLRGWSFWPGGIWPEGLLTGRSVVPNSGERGSMEIRYVALAAAVVGAAVFVGMLRGGTS